MDFELFSAKEVSNDDKAQGIARGSVEVEVTGGEKAKD